MTRSNQIEVIISTERRRRWSAEDKKAIASNDPSIDYFFYMRQDGMYLGGIEKGFIQGDAVFFSGKPHWGSAWCADGYIKA